MTLMHTKTQAVHEDAGFFDAIADIIAAFRDRVESVIGRGNLKWFLLILLLLLALWYVRRRRLTSL